MIVDWSAFGIEVRCFFLNSLLTLMLAISLASRSLGLPWSRTLLGPPLRQIQKYALLHLLDLWVVVRRLSRKVSSVWSLVLRCRVENDDRNYFIPSSPGLRLHERKYSEGAPIRSRLRYGGVMSRITVKTAVSEPLYTVERLVYRMSSRS